MLAAATLTSVEPLDDLTDTRAVEASVVAPVREPDWQKLARCSDAKGSMIELFFSEQIDDINTAKAFCQECVVKAECLAGAVTRREPWGVWGGELFLNGKILPYKRKRGRPPKVRPEAELQAQSA